MLNRLDDDFVTNFKNG